MFYMVTREIKKGRTQKPEWLYILPDAFGGIIHDYSVVILQTM